MKREYILRYYDGEDWEALKAPFGHRFRCRCGKIVDEDWVYDRACLWCRGKGTLRRRLNRREHHALLVEWEKMAKIDRRVFWEDTARERREQRQRRIEAALAPEYRNRREKTWRDC